MNPKRQVEIARHEQELALKQASELAKQRNNERILVSQQWSPIVSALLDETARATWGSNRYRIVAPDSVNSGSWVAARFGQQQIENYQVHLAFTDRDTASSPGSSYSSTERMYYFVVQGAESLACNLDKGELQSALLTAFRSGPSVSVDSATYERLRRTRYAGGEYDGGVKVALVIGCVITAAIGYWLLTARPSADLNLTPEMLAMVEQSNRQMAPFALVLLLLPLIMLFITRFGLRWHRLSPFERILGYTAAMPGFLLIGLAIYILAAAGIVIRDDLRQAERKSEMSDAMTDALNRWNPKD